VSEHIVDTRTALLGDICHPSSLGHSPHRLSQSAGLHESRCERVIHVSGGAKGTTESLLVQRLLKAVRVGAQIRAPAVDAASRDTHDAVVDA
jgi:hypothetical protein